MWPVHWAVHQANGGNSGQVETLPLACKQEVLKYVVLGYFNKEIADKLHITAATVAFHRNNISEKLGSRSLGHLTIYAVMHGIVRIDEL